MQKQNRILAALDGADFTALAEYLEPVDLPRNLELSVPRTVAEYCYFPTSGIISTVAVSSEGRQVEVGVIGREGMSPVSVILGSDQNPYRTVMQVSGAGWRITATALTGVLEERAAARAILLRWAQAYSTQMAFTALSHSIDPVDRKLARWILMCHDRLDGERLALTHEFLSIMLAVRRPSVTNSLHVLEGEGMIRAERATIFVRDRERLQAFAGDSYGASEREYARLFPSMN